MKMAECTKETAYYPMTPEEFHEKQRTTGWCLYAISRVVLFFLKLFKVEEHDWHGICKYYMIGKCWGGLEFGDFFICDKSPSESLMCHEVGHAIQNANVGGFRMVLYFIGSGIRYWAREIKKPKTAYDDWYYEGNATAIGRTYLQKLKEEQNNVTEN